MSERIQFVVALFAGILGVLSLAGSVMLFALGLPEAGGSVLGFAGVCGIGALIAKLAGNGRNSAPLILAGALAASMGTACAGVQKTACAVWDGTHRVACELCARTEGGCPLGPAQGHAHEPEGP